MAKLLKFLVYLGILTFAGVSLAGSKAQDRLLQTGITKPELPWVDAPGIFGKGLSNGTQLDGGGSALLKNGGNGKGSGGKGGGKSGGTEYTQPGAGSGSGSGSSNGGEEKSGSTPGSPGEMSSSSTPGGGGARKLPRFYPMCLFIDSMYSSAEGSKTIKGLVDQAAACNVSLVVFPFTLKPGYPESPSVINAAQQKMCNIPQAGIAPAASTSSCVSHPLSADKMCVSDPLPPKYENEVAGCAQLQAARGVGYQYKDKAEEEAFKHGAHGGGGSAAGGVAAPSIEDAGKCDTSTVGHEALGHSQFGHPNGEGSGHAIKGVGGGDGEGWTGYGCSKIFANAFENDGRWTYDPNQQTYYTKPKNPEAWKDINNPEPIFKAEKQVAQQAQPPQLNTPPGQRITMTEAPKAQDASKVPPAQKPEQKAQMDEGKDGRHRKLATALTTLLSGKREDVVDGPGELEKPSKFAANPKAPPNYPPKNPGPRIGFDDAAPKGRSIKGGGATVTSVESAPSEVYGESSDGAPGEVSAASPAGASMSPSGSYAGGTGSGAKVGFDDNAPKAGLGGNAYYNDRSPASVGSDGVNRVSGVVRVGGSSARSELGDEEEFFDEIGEEGQPAKRKQQGYRRRPAIRDLAGARENGITRARSPK